LTTVDVERSIAPKFIFSWFPRFSSLFRVTKGVTEASMIRAVSTALTLFFASVLAQAGTTSTTATTSDPQAIAYAQQAMTALTGGSAVTDVTLQGSVAEYLGNSTNGLATIQAKGYTESLYNSQASQRQEVRGFDSSGLPAGAWVDSSGASHRIATHNMWTDASWFFPAFSSLSVANNPQTIASYVGQETRYGISVQHLRFQKYLSTQPANVTAFVWHASQEDIYLDALSLLPVGMTFNLHPDNNANTNIAVEIVFSQYQSLSAGIQAPYHVQKYVNGGLVLDFLATSAVINSGLSDSNFTVQ
jgi:hypothetical protein